MTAEQWGVILLLSNSAEPLSQTALAEQLYLEKSSVSRSVSVLVKRGWLVRQPAAQDNRLKLVSLTRKAVSIASRCADIAHQVLQEAQRGTEPTDINTSHQQLQHVIDNLRVLTTSLSDEQGAQ